MSASGPSGPLVCNYLRPSNNSRQLIFSINAVVLIVIIF